MAERKNIREDMAGPVRSGLLSDAELEAIEKENPEGMTSKDIVDLFTSRGVKLSEATLRKYVQLGLLPRSRRVRRVGQRRGSLGLYPVSVVRRINEIKVLLAEDLTMEEIRQKFWCATSEFDELEESIARVFTRLRSALDGRDVQPDQVDILSRDLGEAQRLASQLTGALRHLVDRLEARAREERKVV